MPPVSVCHQVSITAQRPSPTTSWYHCQAPGLIGSPTEPSRRREPRSLRLTGASPCAISARMTVGAVYRVLTSCRATISQSRPASGQVGTPSYISVVPPLASGP